MRDPGFEGEASCSAFSPDGVFLALARSDNETHVYDVRYLARGRGRGPLFMYRHTGECRAASASVRYGVVKAQWLRSARSRRMALVTGGDDGCVRVWDPQVAVDDATNGAVVAEVHSDIGHFSIGDPFAGEHRLVVYVPVAIRPCLADTNLYIFSGDCSGEVYFFNNII